MSDHPPESQHEISRPRPRHKGLYILPSLFTAINIAAGYYAISQAILGTASDPWHFDQAAKAIGFAILFDGLDGRIARLTNTASAFGRELDSLADVIAFGIAPAILAWLWGFRALPLMDDLELRNKVVQFGAIATFVFLMAGAARLARFNIQVNPQPSNPGRPGKKYFVGMPIPAGGGGAFRQRKSAPALVALNRVGRVRFCYRLPDGQHLALLQFQGNQSAQAPEFPLDHRLRRHHRIGLVLLALRAVPAGVGVHPRGCAGAALLCFPAA